MPALKSYTLGNNGFVPPPAREALGQPVGRNQAHIVIVAATKRAAAELAESVGLRVVASDSEFRQIDAPTIRAFAGDTPGVFASPMIRRDGDPVLELFANGLRVVGRYRTNGIEWAEAR